MPFAPLPSCSPYRYFRIVAKLSVGSTSNIVTFSVASSEGGAITKFPTGLFVVFRKQGDLFVCGIFVIGGVVFLSIFDEFLYFGRREVPQNPHEAAPRLQEVPPR